MKKYLVLMLLISINSHPYAQSSMFPTAEKYLQKIWIDLGQSNKLQLTTADLNTIGQLENIDSLLNSFLDQVNFLKDSTAGGVQSISIIYQSDPSGQNLVSMQKFSPQATNFVVLKGEPSFLKIEQDTVKILGPVQQTGMSPWELEFYLNDLWDLQNYIGIGLFERLRQAQSADSKSWTRRKDGRSQLKTDPAVIMLTAEKRAENFLAFYLAVGIQNYRSAFVPSFAEGVAWVNTRLGVKREIGLYAEQLFSFSKDNNQKLQTAVSHCLSISYDKAQIANVDNYKITLPLHFSLGYFIKTKGSIFDKGTFRLGAGRLTALGGKTTIEPIIYFNDFFKQVSPGIRLLQRF